MRIGLFGGTFDPVHLGHLVLAEQAREQAGLDEVWFVPAARPPHKTDLELSPFARRVEMIELAIAGNAAFRVDLLEKDRPGPSFTVDTLEELHRRQPGKEFFWLVGSDCLPDLASWRQPARILELAGLFVWERPGSPVWPAERLRAALPLPEGVPLRYQAGQGPQVLIASRDLRARATSGRSLRYLVPRAVECYIATHQLYRTGG